MHVLLIYISLIMILSFVARSNVVEVQDLSEWCSEGRSMNYNLTYGAGTSDKFVIVIANAIITNCTLKFFVKAGNHIMVVLEFPVLKRDEKICFTQENTSVTVRDNTENGPTNCGEMGQLHRIMSKENFSVHFRIRGRISTVKIIATSMRDPKSMKHCGDKEVGCVFGKKLFCMTNVVLCDGYNNCGVQGLYDEDEVNCNEIQLDEREKLQYGDEYSTTGLEFSVPFVTVSMFTVLLTFGLMYSIALHLIPKQKETYVHNFDQTMSLFDCANGIITVDINIIVMFPDQNR